MASEDLGLEEWLPKYPKLKVLADELKSAASRISVKGELAEEIVKGFLTGPAKLAETVAYDEPLYTGKNQTFRPKPETAEALNLLGPTTKGVGALASIGPIGIKRLAETEPMLQRTVSRIAEVLRKTKPEDWRLQKEIVENADPQFFAVPRGRDAEMLPHIKFGAEIPEAKAKHVEEILGYKQKLSIPLEAILDSPRHFKAYPQLREWKVYFDPAKEVGSGFANYAQKGIGIGPAVSIKQFEKILQHELGHVVQRFERWPVGTSVHQAEENLMAIGAMERAGVDLPKDLKKQLDLAKQLRWGENLEENIVPKNIAYREYRRAAGEQLAEALARSHAEGGGKVTAHYTQPASVMYDPELQESRIKALEQAFSARLWGLE